MLNELATKWLIRSAYKKLIASVLKTIRVVVVWMNKGCSCKEERVEVRYTRTRHTCITSLMISSFGVWEKVVFLQAAVMGALPRSRPPVVSVVRSFHWCWAYLPYRARHLIMKECRHEEELVRSRMNNAGCTWSLISGCSALRFCIIFELVFRSLLREPPPPTPTPFVCCCCYCSYCLW